MAAQSVKAAKRKIISVSQRKLKMKTQLVKARKCLGENESISRREKK